jgi:hypothetical protein
VTSSGDDQHQQNTNCGDEQNNRHNTQETSPEMTIKALLNYQSGVGERVVIRNGDEKYERRTDCGDDKSQEQSPEMTEKALSNNKPGVRERAAGSCGVIEHLTRTFTELQLQKNKHKIQPELKQVKQREKLKRNNDCNKIAGKDEQTEIKSVCDFRRMARSQEGRKGVVKRLQDGPRERRTKELRKRTGTILRKLVTSLTQMIPEIQMEKAGRNFTKYTSRKEREAPRMASQMEECLTLLDTLTVSGKFEEVTDKLGSITMEVAKLEIEKEDMSFWEELEILNEEDFSCPEKLEEMEKAANILMKKFRSDEDEKTSQEEDAQPEGKSPPDNFFIEEYEKMMEEEGKADPTIQGEDKEIEKKTTNNQEEEEEDIPHNISSQEEEKEEDLPQTKAETPPTSPPNKRQKIRTPVKKTTRSPKLPQKKKSPRKTPTPTKKMTTQRKIDFNFGRQPERNDQEDQIGKVRKEKMKIEERLRKEKRDRKIEEIRKPIIMTPGTKRRRQEDGEWEQPEGEDGPVAAQTPGGAKIKMKQTPIQTFLVSQTMEDRKSSWNSNNKPRKLATPLRKKTDKSASFASPNLRKPSGMKTGARKGQEAMEKMQRSPNQVNIIAKYFEPDQKPCQKPRSNWSCRNTDNNNMMCNETDHGQHPTIPSVTSTSRRPEMSSQSGQPNQTEQPMREHHTGHVTRISDRQPIEARPENQHGLRDEGSHLGSQEGPE